MTGGYVSYNGRRSPLKNNPKSSKNIYVFTPGIFERIEDDADFKFYKWRMSKSNLEANGEKTWVAKERLAKDDKSRSKQIKKRSFVDKLDPNFDISEQHKKAQEKIKEADEICRKSFGQTLPEYLKKQKKVGGK